MPENEAAYVGKPPGYFVGIIFRRFFVGYLVIIVLVRMAGSNGVRLIPQSLEPAAIDFVSFIFPAFKVQYEQLATLADKNVQSQYLAVIFFAMSFGFWVTSLTVVKYYRVWRQLTAPSVGSFFIFLIALQASAWVLIFEKFKPAMGSLTDLFYDNKFGWFFIRQTGVVFGAQLFGITMILMIAQVILTSSNRSKNGG